MHSDNAVADRVRRPLYRFQASELHVTGHSVGGHLSGASESATEWKAILILDGGSCSTRKILDSSTVPKPIYSRQTFTQ